MMKKWKYKTVKIGLREEALNNLGLKGWELVSHTAIVANFEIVQHYIFKQQIYDTSSTQSNNEAESQKEN